MADHNELGKVGEEKAVAYLKNNQYKILHTNWRSGKEEIDIIAEHENHIAIVEVKTRTSEEFGSPEEFISKRKQQHLIKAANAFSEQFEIQKDIYFDVIAIVLQPKFSLQHIKEAFYP